MSVLDPKLCFVCQTASNRNTHVVTEKGLAKLFECSVQRQNHTHQRFLKSGKEVRVHHDCQKNYVNDRMIAAYIRRGVDSTQTSLSLRSSTFSSLKTNASYVEKVIPMTSTKNNQKSPTQKEI